MRVLVCSTAGAGHVGAVAPLAAALRAHGHDVHWAVSSDGVAAVARLGFTALPAGMPVAERRETLAPRLPAIMALPPVERRGPLFSGFFASAAAPRMRTDLAPVVDRLRPSLIVHETAELAAAPIAVARGIPHVTVAFSGALTEAAVALVLDAIEPVWRAEGLGRPDEAALMGERYFHPFPPSLGHTPRVEVAVPMRPAAATAAAPAPGWLAKFGSERPGLYLTAGTERAAPDAPWAAAVQAIAHLDVDAVATLGRHVDIGALGRIPGNLRVETFVPQAQLLPRVSVVMSHGGAGTILGAAAAGVPQVITPLFADQWDNGAAICGAGAAILLPPDRRSVADITGALSTALMDDGMRAAAARVADEIAAMPTADDHVTALEAIGG